MDMRPEFRPIRLEKLVFVFMVIEATTSYELAIPSILFRSDVPTLM